MAKKRKAKHYDYVDQLLPCPFCGEKNLLWEGFMMAESQRGTRITCWTCWCEGPDVKNFKNGKGDFRSAKKLWNTRPASVPQRRGAKP